MAQDEGRFGRINPPRRCWAPKPIRPVVRNQIVHEFLYVFAAVCPYLGRLTALILPYANTEMMTLFLQQVAVDFRDYIVVMLLDQAAWHTTHKLAVPENMRLLPLPPGSPELNPTEHLWEDLRENEMANQPFDSLDRVEDALCHGINRLAANPGCLRSLTNFPYLRLTL
jgi:transposase